MKRKKRRQKAQKKTRRTKTRCAPTGGRRALPSYVPESGVPAGAAGAHISSPAVLRQALAFLQAGRPQEALRLCRQILTAQPDHTDALNLGGVAAFQSGDVNQGLKLVQGAVARRPEYVDAHNNLGNMLKALGRFDEAEAAYRRALKIKPDHFDAHYNLGIVLEASARFNEAEAAYGCALEINPGFAEAHFNLGNALKALGKLDEAVGAYGRALKIRPDHADAHTNLGSVLWELGKFDEAEAAYGCALEIKPDHADAHYNHGIVLQERGRFDEAIAAYHRALDIKPDYTEAHVNLGYALKKLGRLDEAEAAYRRAIVILPDHAPAHANLGDVLLEQGDPQAAVDVCDAYLKVHPCNSCVLAFKAIALDELGQRDTVRFLVDFDRFIRPVRSTAPAGFTSLADFNAALARHVCAHPTLVFAPASHATRLGKHSGELLVEPKGPVAVLEGMIRGAAEDYLHSLPADPAHPFLANRPQGLWLTAWSIVLEAQGHQLPHIHPTAWLSGVYYVELPDIVKTPAQGQAGWIEFGRPSSHFHCRVEPEVRAFQPEEGLMLLFPSYFYHRTVPFESAGKRISISFDVRPVN